MRFEPHGYQQYGIDFILGHKKCGLFLDMGLGKTVTTLTAIMALKYDRFEVSKVLVIAPKKVAESTWTKESAKWEHTRLLRVSTVLGSESKRVKALHSPADIWVINRENVCWLVDYYRNAWPFDMVVVDESSSFKSHKAKRFKSLAAVSPHINRLVLLTGTPSPNGVEDLWSQIYLIDQGERLEKRYTHFRERYLEPDTYGPHGMVYKYAAKSGSFDAVLNQVSDVVVSMKAKDYLELPDVVFNRIDVELDPGAKKKYRELEREMILQLPEGDLSVTSAAALSNKLLQLANGAVYDESQNVLPVHDCKLEAFSEVLEGLNGQSALVFYNFKHDKTRLLECLSKSGLRVRELTCPADEDAWNAGEVDVLLAHPASCAYGLNLQAGGHNIIWFGLTWNYEQYVQANARLHRQGQSAPVVVHHIVCTGTRDEDVITALSCKEQAQNYVLESLKARIRVVKEEKG